MKNRKLLISGVFIVMVLILSACAMGPRAIGTPGLTADDEIVYVSYQQFVYAVDARTGMEIWRYPASGSAQVVFYAPSLVTEDAVYVGDLANKFHKINKENGLNLWTFSGAKGWFIGQAFESEGLVFAQSSDRYVYALDATDGAELWSYETGHQNWAQPVSDGTKVYIASLDHFVYAVNRQGEMVWSTELNGASIGSPVYDEANQQIFVATIGNALYALDSKTGRINWQFDQAKSSLWATPVLVEEVVYVSDEAGTVYAFDAANGKPVWSKDVATKAMGGLLAVEKGFILATEDGSIMAIDFDGNPLWTRTVDGEIYTTPVKTTENLVIATIKGDNLLYGFDLNGNQVWAFAPGK